MHTVSDDDIDLLVATNFCKMFRHNGSWWDRNGNLYPNSWSPARNVTLCMGLLSRFTAKGWTVEIFDSPLPTCVLSKDERRFSGEDRSEARAAGIAVLKTKGLWKGQGTDGLVRQGQLRRGVVGLGRLGAVGSGKDRHGRVK
jgi:hypothetical protein